MTVIVKKTGQSNKVQDIKAHIKYIGFRSQEIEKKEKGVFFNFKHDVVNYKSFIKNLEENKALKHPKSIKAHKLIFSLTNYQYEEYLKSGKDFKDIVREVLKDVERQKGIKLDWIGSMHLVDGKGKNHHPHCHIVISGVSKEDKNGKVQRVKFTKEDFQKIRESFDLEVKKEIGHMERRPCGKFERGESSDIKIIMKDITKSFEVVTNKIKRELKKDQFYKELRNKKDKIREERNKKSKERER